MDENIKKWTIAGVIGTFISVAIGVVLTVYFNREKSTSLEIKKVNDIELTRPLNVSRLSSWYLYDSIPVEHLWQSTCVIKNNGETTIYGEGFENKNIRGNALKLHINNSNQVLSLNITETNTDAFLIGDSLKFTQWRQNEYVELVLLSDGQNAPEILINDRDIQNAAVTYVSYSPEEQLVPKRYVDRFPRALYKTLRWIAISFEVIIFIGLVIEAIDGYRRQKKGYQRIIYIIVWVMAISIFLIPILWML